MTSAVHRLPSDAATAAVPRLRGSAEPLRNALLWLTGASGALVFIEPSPYEVFSLLTICVFTVSGLTVRAGLLPVALLLILINIGYSISAMPFFDDQAVLMWILTSWYLAMTSLFLAAATGANTRERVAFLTRGYVIAGVIASAAAIVGYARLFPAANETLLLYDRARGTFKDPNVLGAFLVFPALACAQRVISGRFRDVWRGGGLLLVIAAALFLSFSRAAWGQFVFAAGVMMLLMFITTDSANHRLRIVLAGIAAVVVLAASLTALLSIDAVANLFEQRARLDQDYDAGAVGRFARHYLGALLALDMPWGIGPRQFSTYFPEDPHNSYLNAFMSGGWLSGICYPALGLLTLAHGFRTVFIATPWRSLHILYFSAYLGTFVERFIIDIDHWRHHFLCTGVLWGLILAARAHRAPARRPVPPTAALAPAAA
jgi:hypothetical protein